MASAMERSAFKTLKELASGSGLPVPAGLTHVLLHHGTSRKEVYKYMYGQLVYGGKLVSAGTTLVYPEPIRAVVRERFSGEAGAYDAQYEEKGTYLSLEEVLPLPVEGPAQEV